MKIISISGINSFKNQEVAELMAKTLNAKNNKHIWEVYDLYTPLYKMAAILAHKKDWRYFQEEKNQNAKLPNELCISLKRLEHFMVELDIFEVKSDNDFSEQKGLIAMDFYSVKEFLEELYQNIISLWGRNFFINHFITHHSDTLSLELQEPHKIITNLKYKMELQTLQKYNSLDILVEAPLSLDTLINITGLHGYYEIIGCRPTNDFDGTEGYTYKVLEKLKAFQYRKSFNLELYKDDVLNIIDDRVLGENGDIEKAYYKIRKKIFKYAEPSYRLWKYTDEFIDNVCMDYLKRFKAI